MRVTIFSRYRCDQGQRADRRAAPHRYRQWMFFAYRSDRPIAVSSRFCTLLSHIRRQTSPLFLLDELDKAPSLSGGDNTLDVLLSLLEQENAQASSTNTLASR